MKFKCTSSNKPPVLPVIPTVYMLVSPVVNMSHQYVKLMRLIKARL